MCKIKYIIIVLNLIFIGCVSELASEPVDTAAIKPPVNIRVYSEDSKKVYISWNNEEGVNYEIYQSTDMEKDFLISTGEFIFSNIFVVRNLNPETLYYFKIKSKAGDSESEYSVVVSGKTLPSDGISVIEDKSSLKVDGIEIYKNGKVYYEFIVSEEKESINLEFIPYDIQNVIVTGDTGILKLSEMENVFSIKVLSLADLSLKEYIVNIIKINERNLKTIYLDESALYMSKEEYYKIEIDSKIEMVNLIVTTDFKNAEIIGNGVKRIDVGTNKFEIVVIIEKEIYTYGIILEKKSE